MKNNILFEDSSIIVCVKPVGVESEGAGMPALLQAQCALKEVYCVHRLDKAVGGVMVYTKTRAAAAALSKAIAERRIEKEYLAVLPARPDKDEAVLRDLLYRDAKKNKSFVVKRMRRGVREAELEYKLCEASNSLSLVRIKLHTGRSHQIRVQFASRGLPLLGDVKYGSGFKDCQIALFACALAFSHPVSGEAMRFSAAPESVFPWNNFNIQESNL